MQRKITCKQIQSMLYLLILHTSVNYMLQGGKMNKEKAYFLVIILGIVTLTIIFLISKFMSKIFENKNYPKII